VIKVEIFVPQILIPRFMEFEDPANVGLGVWGEYHVIKKRRGVVVQELKMKNIITDIGLNRLASNDEWLYHRCRVLHLGTGTATPVTTDQTLQARGFSKDTNTSSTGGLGAAPDYYYQIVYDLGLSEAIGNWTEVGVGWQNSSPWPVFSRVLFKDDQGNPITVQKTGEDTLTIIYKVHVKRLSDVPFSDVVDVTGIGNVTVDSILINQQLKALTEKGVSWTSAYTASYYYLGTNGDPIDASVLTRTGRNPHRNVINTGASLNQMQSYVAGTSYRDFITEWPASIVANIGEAVVSMCDAWEKPGVFLRFNPVIPKDNTKKFRVGWRVTYNRV